MALPEPVDPGGRRLLAAVREVVRTIGLHVPEDAGHRARGSEEDWARAALMAACREGAVLPGAAFDALVTAAVADPNPSFNRQFVEPALNAFGRAAVRSALLQRLRTGTDAEKAGAARAWYWSGLPLRLPRVVAEPGAARPESDADGQAELVRAWHETALREFVANDHLDVRRCLLPRLPLRESAYPPELHGLVAAAIALARSHPDTYIRHRVEIQVGR